MPGSLEDIPLTIITTLEQLQQLKAELMNVKEFAIDMEVHVNYVSCISCCASPKWEWNAHFEYCCAEFSNSMQIRPVRVLLQ